MKICDRCRNPIQDNSMLSITFPYYSISILYFNNSYSLMSGTPIDLCEDCKQKIIDFIKENK